MITLTLLHPIQSIPVQSWTFEAQSVIRIGRSTDNDVILYSAVVSRHHVELQRTGLSWEIVSLGTNGTYLDGKRITKVPVVDGVIIRLARSGPNIQIHLGETAAKERLESLSGEQTLAQRVRSRSGDAGVSDPAKEVETQAIEIPVPLHLQLSSYSTEPSGSEAGTITSPGVAAEPEIATPRSKGGSPAGCLHPRISADLLFCLDCGQPLRSRQTIGGYQVLKILGQGSTSITYLVWRQGQNFVLKTLNSKRVNHPQARLLFEHEARILMQLNHPGMPRFLDFFSVMGQPYLVMEMIHGQTLFQQVAAQGVVSQAQAIAWLLEVCDVLEYLHASVPPMLHRDIKPSHLIRRVVPHAAQEIVLVDFGAVKVLALETDHSVAAGYMAPEQQQGQATPASDLYALGSTLIYLLTGQEPSLFYRQGEQGFRIYVEDVPELNPQVTAVIRTLTHPHPQQRYPSVKALATALRQISL